VTAYPDTDGHRTGDLDDDAVRDRIRRDLSATLFVEAGAGSGKTAALVDRVGAHVLDAGEPLTGIAAVTFTEKAGAELRDRLRARFAHEVASGDPRHRDRALAALADLDVAAIGTLHGFARRVLAAHPVPAGLPPTIEVLDEVASSAAAQRRWEAMRRELLDDADLADAVLLAFSTGSGLDQVRSLARAFTHDWDLLDEHVLAHRPPPARLPDVRPVIDALLSCTERRDECTDDTDRFLLRLMILRDRAYRLRDASTDVERFTELRTIEALRFGGAGRSGSWADLAGLRAQCERARDEAGALADGYAEAALRPLAHWVAGRVVRDAHERAAQGRLEFHDLLVLARNLLRTDADARADLQREYRRLLLDEFQDTDPIQIELAVRIAAGAAGGAANWHHVPVPPGSLFLVGDPKQSIYRFRRASIETYLSAQNRVGEHVALSSNFRTVRPVLDWVDAVFGELIQADGHTQPAYRPLAPARQGQGEGPAVVVLGRDEHLDRPDADTLRSREAADVAATIGTALAQGWTVQADERDGGGWRPVRPGDIAVLLPTRTSLPHLEEALDAAGIPFRAEAGSLVYGSADVRDLMAAARAVADPSDALSLLTALRSPLFGCGDDDLWTWRRDGGAFHLFAPAPEGGSPAHHPVGEALASLRRLHRLARWAAPGEVLAALVEERRVLEVAAARPGADARGTRDAWRRIRFVVDQARAWSDVEHGGLRDYLAWAALQADETSRVAEAVLPETDLDVVRVMTVHAAKGLEFGMVVLSGTTSRPAARRGVQVLWTAPGGVPGYSARLSKHVQTNDFQSMQPLDEQMDAQERKRLLYVAATRARDHLVVSLHRREAGPPTAARLLAEAGAEAGAVALDPGDVVVTARTPPDDAPPVPDRYATLERLALAQERSRAVSVRTASGLAGTEPEVALPEVLPEIVEHHVPSQPGDAKGPADLDLPPWTRGRYGNRVGRAVHGVLQQIDLRTGVGLGRAVAAQCLAEGVTEHAEAVAAFARSALASGLVRRAARHRHWRETYVATELDDGALLEGFVDLVFEDDDGTLVVVDYKTDVLPSALVDERVAHYAPQIRAYHRALAAATGAEVAGHLLFLNRRGDPAFPVAVTGPLP
jgi:ATP-dependent helicase/nuclease subunit A